MDNQKLGDLIDLLYEKKVEMDELNSKKSNLNSEIEKLEYAILTQMEEVGVDKVKATKGTASLKVDLYPQIKDMDAFISWIAQSGRVDMIQKRVSSSAFKEFFESEGMYPDGIDAFNKKTINFRKAR